jgi:hypothetical protein
MATSFATIAKNCAGDLGLVAANEVLDAATSEDFLRRCNTMLAGWRTQYGTTLAVERFAFPLTANKQTYTIGIGGDFNVPRPVGSIPGAALWLNGLNAAQAVTSILRSGTTATVTLPTHGLSVGDETLIAGADDDAYNGIQTIETVPTVNTFTYTLESEPDSPATGTITSAAVNGQPVEIPRPVITDDAYQAIQIKNLPNAQFTNVYYNPSAGPFGVFTLWPKPNTAVNQLILYLRGVFAGFADLATEYDYPDIPGYAEAIQYQLDLRLLTPYGVKDPSIIELVTGMARDTFGLIKRANNRLTDIPTDASLLSWNPRSFYNINTGQGGGSGG